MSDIALYFPFVNLPDDAWVKAAALNWPQLGRLRPLHYRRLRDSDTVARLRDELDFVVDVRPGWGEQSCVDRRVLDRVDGGSGRRNAWIGVEDEINALFFDFLDRYQDELTPRYGAEALGIEPLHTKTVYDRLLPLDPRLREVHSAKISWALARRLADDGLLVSRHYRWHRADDDKVLYISDIAMHERLAHLFLAVLADVVARTNGMTPVTDQPLHCAAASGWTIESMAQVLLADDPPTPEADADLSEVFAVLALQTVLPAGLADVPVERIVEARKRLLPELMRYRAFLDSLVADFVEISAVPDPAVRAAKLRNHVESQVKQPIESMERGLGRLGLQPVRAVLTLQTLAPPTALGVLSEAVHLPSAVTGAGVVAGCLVGAAHKAIDERKQVLAGHPAGYLLSLRHELGPADAVARIRSAMRRAAPRRRDA